MSISFAAYGICLVMTPKIDSYGQFCRWVGNSFLCILAGVAGCLLEIKGHLARKQFGHFAINRIGSGFFYLWLGFYVMGLEEDLKDGPTALLVIARTTGIVSWVVGLLNLMVSCTVQRSVQDNSKGFKDALCSDSEDESGSSSHQSNNDMSDGLLTAATVWNNSTVKPFGVS